MKNLAGFHRAAAAALLTAATAFASTAVFSPQAAAPPPPPSVLIDVNSTSDAVANDGLCTLREAITSANTNSASGAASGECNAGGVDEMIDFEVEGVINLTGALPAVSSNVIIAGPGSSRLTVRRDTGGNYRIFTVNSGATVTISGLTVSNGRTADGAPGSPFGNAGGGGGGVSNAGTLTLASCVITGNTTGNGGVGTASDSSSFGGAGGPGGGVYNTGTLTMTDCSVTSNHTGNGATAGYAGGGGSGGGIYSYPGALTLSHCVVSNNTTGTGVPGSNPGASGGGGGSGGGIYTDAGTMNITDTVVSNNVTGNGSNESGAGGHGGGIYAGGSTFPSNPVSVLTNVTVKDNRTGDGAPVGFAGQGGFGGGIFNGGNMTASLITISGNVTGTSSGNGGGVGGGMDNSGTLNMSNATVSGNSTTGPGGTGAGLWNAGTANLTNCTIAFNNTAAGFGGAGIHVFNSFYTVNIRNTIVARNTQTGITNAADVGGPNFNSQGHNLVGNADGVTTFNASGDMAGTTAAPLNPRLAALGNNGGPTETHALLAGSPALDAGDNALAKDASDNALTTDQRGAGFPRVADSADADATQTVDIGAFEAHPTVENINDKTTVEDSPITFAFNVGDAALGLTSVTASSSNASLVPNDSGHISVTGTGSQRTLNLTPAADAVGASTVTVTATASNGRTAADTFTLNVTPVNDQPTGVALSNNVVADNSPAGTNVGTLSTADPDSGDTFAYALVGGAGGLDNGSFAVSGSTLKTAAVLDYETRRVYSVRVRSTDSGGLSVESVLLVNVSDGPDSPGALSFSAAAFNANESAGVASITLTRTGGADNKVFAKVTAADVTTSPSDYRFSPGSLDTTFDGNGSNTQAIALQPDGKVIIGTARLNADGSPDNTFNMGSGGGIRTITLQPDGKVIIGANLTLARLNSDGSPDNTFSPGVGLGISDGTADPGPRIRATALQPDGKILVGGIFYVQNEVKGLARLNPDGSLDGSFPARDGDVFSIAVQPDGKILVEGTLRLNPDGSVDGTFNSGGANGVVRATAIQPDGKIIIGGDFTTVGGVARNGIARLNAGGSLDNTFNPGAGVSGSQVAGVHTLILQPDGKVFIGGEFTFVNGTARNHFARLNSNGSLDTTFNPGAGANNAVRAAVMQPDGRIIIGGSFTNVGGVARNGIARLYGDLFATWEAGDSSNKTITLPLVDDATPEPNETLSLSLTPLGGATAGAHTSATLTITDNDAAVSSVSGSGVYGGTATLTATLTLSGSPLSGKSVAFTLNGNSVGSATTNASGVATVTDVSLAGVNAGTYPGAVGASFAGGAGISGSSGTGALTVSKASQTINFGALPDKTFGDADFTISATASSGLPVSFGAITGSPCTVTGNTVHIDGAGSCRITATQFGDSNYNGAAAVSRDFNIAQASTSVAVSSSVNPSGVGQSVTFTATVTSPAGPPPGGILGTVNFFADGVAIPNCASLLNSGQASCTTSALTAGSHVITAQYSTTSPNFTGSNGTLQGGQAVAAGGVIGFSENFFVSERTGGSVTVTVKRSGSASLAVDVDYATDDGSTPGVVVPCSSVTGLALDRCDYTKAVGTLHFAAGESEKTFVVLVNDDTYVEGQESADVRLSNPTGGAALGPRPVTSVIIGDDSPESPGNPIDDDQNFVRQHYHDFLNREPDAAGLAFWTSQITSCGANAQCREVKRVNVSAAFFLSIEFQETGYLVERTYKAAFGDATSPNVSGTVPVIRLDEFLPDTQRIGSGVQVGIGDWQAQLEANKVAYFQEFVSRPRFANGAPASMTPAQLVDALFANAGVTPTASERQAAINEFGGASNTSDADARARVLRRVAEHPTLNQLEKNRAFVLMEYFGYMRRNPNDSPEPTLNYAGWRFWLDKLNQFNGDFVRAEMVKAFLSSDEYRNRFGQ